MSDAQSIQFRNKSISQLVHELNQLGDDHVLMHPTTLIAVQDQSSQSIRRFRSKSTHKSRTTQTQLSPSTNKQMQMSQFFLIDGSQKKYYYDEITNDLETLIIGNVLNKFQQNFNTTLIMQYKQDRFHQLLYKIQPWIESSNIDKQFYASFIQFRAKQAIDLLSGNNNNVRSMSLAQASEKNQQVYQCKIQDIIKVKNMNENYIKILKISKKNSKNSSQIRIILLPQNIFFPNIQDPSLKIVKSQLFQIINYIKVNPNKKYQNINKLLPKRYPTTTALATNLLYDTVNYVINWVTDCKENKNLVNGRFQFYSKIAGISNLVKKVQQNSINKKIIKIKRNISKSPKPTKQITSTTDLNRIPQQNKINLEGTQARSMSQFQYCRSLQRKTHKYSIAQFDSANDERLFPQTLPYYPLCAQLNENQAITVLKAQHARQISQYHQTIQNLNQKILILTSEKGISQIFTIHEREIMLLEMKIDQLRKDISKMCATPSKQRDTQNLKDIIKKLNQQLAVYQKTNPSHKISQGKIKMMEHELTQWKNKYQKSEIARKQLRLELQAATNRLKIKDEQTKKLMQRQQKTYKDEDLSAKQMNILQQIQQLSKNGLNKENAKYVCRKFKNILGNLSQLRQTILQCHNFLVDLQEHIQSRLSQKDPDVVLDCNRFIRTYLLNNLSIF